MFDIDQDKAQQIIGSFQIPVKPQVLSDLQQEQSKPEPSPNIFAEIIARDVALSANILKAINSPIFGLNRTIADIKQSVIMLGTDNVANIASFFQLQQAFDNTSSISNEKYWDTAMETATMMVILLQQLNLKNNCPIEDAYAFGLFRDCGIPLMAMKYSDYKDTLIDANANPQEIFTSIEDHKYKTNHAVIGYFIASSWNLPKNICELILRHHDPLFLQDKKVSDLQKDLYALAKISSNALQQYKRAEDDCEWFLARDSVLGYLGISEHDYEDIEEDAKEEFKIQFG